MEFKEKSDYAYKLEDMCYSCIYFLLNKGEVCYVGQSNRGMIRALTHYKDKEYDEIRVIVVNEELLDEKEAFYILKYTPKYNFSLPYYISIKSIKQKLKTNYNIRVRIDKIQKYIKANIKNYYYYNSGIYISPEDFEKCMEYFIKN